MNNAHMKSKTAAGGRNTGHALVRRIAAGLLGLAVISSAAVAGPGRDQRSMGGGWQGEAMRQGPIVQQRQYEDRRERQYDNRDDRDYQRADDQRRRMQDQRQAEQQEFRRSGRLTPDERRDLRRQINEAGADIYQRPKRR